ncbi:MAG: type II toxin-antitoxin system HicA family toxin [Erysipelothrix sp.]|nr:type II toxin-antitoxin system HicA family toxin [Erysipelothrix sp.]
MIIGNKDIALWKKLKSKPYSSGVKLRELKSLLLLVGFELVSVTGSHHTFKHPKSDDILTLQERGGSVKPVYTKLVYKTINELELEERIK